MATTMGAWPRSWIPQGTIDELPSYDQMGVQRSIDRSSFKGRADLFTNSKYKVMPARDSMPSHVPYNNNYNNNFIDELAPSTERMPSPLASTSTPSCVPIPIHAPTFEQTFETSRSSVTQSFRRGATPAEKSNGTFLFLAIVGLLVGGAAFAVMGFVKPEATHRSALTFPTSTTPAPADSSTSTPPVTADDAAPPIGSTPSVMVITAPSSPVGGMVERKIAKGASRRASSAQQPQKKNVPALPTNPYDSAAGG